jgi:hypothetical protein
MKVKEIILYIFSFSLLIGCNKDNAPDNISHFKANSSLKNIWEPLKTTVSEMDFSIVYSEGGGAMTDPSWLTHRMFGFKENNWYKIEFKFGIIEIDTIFSDGDGEIVTKEIKLTKKCGTQEAEEFMDQLIKKGLFDLEVESEILKKCTSSETLYHDIPGITFYLIKGKKVRTLHYQYPHEQLAECPESKEWKDIISIIELFKSNWYHKQHY